MTRSIDVSVEIDASIEDVYKALTDASELVRWFPLEAGENEDGSLWMSFGDGHRFSGAVAASERPDHVRLLYRQPPPGRDPKTITEDDLVEIVTDYRLETQGGKTVLRLVHSGFGDGSDWGELYDATRTGWGFQLRGLKHYLENHHGRERIVAWAKAVYPGTRDQAWAQLMSPAGDLRAGERYSTDASFGETLAGEIRLIEPPASFVATVDGWNNAFLGVTLEDYCGVRKANVFLSTYDVPRSDVEAFEKRWQTRLDQLFSE